MQFQKNVIFQSSTRMCDIRRLWFRSSQTANPVYKGFFCSIINSINLILLKKKRIRMPMIRISPAIAHTLVHIIDIALNDHLGFKIITTANQLIEDLSGLLIYITCQYWLSIIVTNAYLPTIHKYERERERDSGSYIQIVIETDLFKVLSLLKIKHKSTLPVYLLFFLFELLLLSLYNIRMGCYISFYNRFIWIEWNSSILFDNNIEQ